MDLTISGIHMELTPSLKNYVKEKVDSLKKHLDGVTKIRVELKTHHGHLKGKIFNAKILVWLPGVVLEAEKSAEEMHAAIDGMEDRIRRQLEKHKTKILSKKHGNKK